MIGWLHEQILLLLGNFAYKNKIVKKSECLIGMFHAQTVEKNKNRVLKSLTEESSIVRVFIATSSLGCGINAIGVKYVVHFGPSYALAYYCQQIGRAGRNTDNQCHAVLFYYNTGRQSFIADDMKNYIACHDTKCLRCMLFTPFNESGHLVQPMQPGHICCSFCAHVVLKVVFQRFNIM